MATLCAWPPLIFFPSSPTLVSKPFLRLSRKLSRHESLIDKLSLFLSKLFFESVIFSRIVLSNKSTF